MNVIVSITFKLLLLVANIFVRRYLIRYLGNDFNGLNSLYISILDFLSVAELGVGSAITFSMYKPIVDGDNDKVAALYKLFTKLYRIIGMVIFICGFLIMPLLPYLANGYQNINVNLYLTFFLMLLSVVLTYTFSSKTSLINAYKNNYITTTISSMGLLFQCGLQIVLLIFTKSFVWFLVCRNIAVVIQWIITELIARRKYYFIIRSVKTIDVKTKNEVTKNIKAMFMHKVGDMLVNTADSLIISTFIGLVILGKYSNYTTIVSAMMGVLVLCFTPLTSVIGHMCVQEDRIQIKRYFDFFHTFNFIMGVIFFLGFYAVIDNLISICFKDGLELARSISFVITLNYFIQFMRRTSLLFRDATGTFYYDRWKPLIEGIFNILLSVLFVTIFPDDLKVVGVIVATIITNLLICHIVEPYVLFKHIFKVSVKPYYLKNYLCILGFSMLLIALNFSMIHIDNQWLELLANGCISVGVSSLTCIGVILFNKDFRYYIKKFFIKMRQK